MKSVKFDPKKENNQGKLRALWSTTILYLKKAQQTSSRNILRQRDDLIKLYC